MIEQGMGRKAGRRRGLGVIAGAAVSVAAAAMALFSLGTARVATGASELEAYLFHDAALAFAGFGDVPAQGALSALEEAGFDAERITHQLITGGVPGPSLSAGSFRSGELDPGQAKQRLCLAQAIYHEARNQPLIGRFAVADVVLNRVGDRRFPSSICNVVFQRHGERQTCQFSFACDGSMNRPKEARAWKEAEALADVIYRGFRPAVTGLATFYHANYVDPYWARTFDETAVIGDHIFYRPPGVVEVAANSLTARLSGSN